MQDRCPNCGKFLSKSGDCSKCGINWSDPDPKALETSRPTRTRRSKTKNILPNKDPKAEKSHLFGFPRSDDEVPKLRFGDEDGDRRAIWGLVSILVVFLMLIGTKAINLLAGSLMLMIFGAVGWLYLILRER